jgi:hypothetical protein
MATSKSKLAIAKNIANKVKTPKRKKVSAERYISQGQNPPQSKAYTEVADEGVGAKPIGYRWTKVGATRLSKNEKVKPSKEDVEKYKNKTFKLKGETHRYLYSEKRVDKSDRSIKAKFKEGGSIKQSKPQSQSYKRSADSKVEAKPVGWRYKGNNYNEPSDNVIKRETAKPRNERKIYFEKRKDKSDYDFFSKLEYGGEATQGAGSFKKGGYTQSGRQSPNYNEAMDGQKMGKPVGYRFTDRLAKRLGVNPHTRPTDAQIEKYNGRGVYFEAREDKSDIKPSKKYISLEYGGEATEGAGSFKKGGYTQSGRQSPNYNEAMDGQKMGKPVGYRFTDRLAKRLGVNPHSRPTDAQIEKYNGRGVYFEAREDKSDIKPSKKYISLEYGGMMAKGGVIKLKSVGSAIDKKTKIVYPLLSNGNVDLEDDGVYLREVTDEWMSSLSKEDREVVNSVNKMADGGMMARGGVERISNQEARTYTENMIPFKGANLEGKTLDNGDYVVLSYGYYPIWWYCKSEGKWYGNSTKYSVSTSKQMSQSRPTYDATMLTRNELEQTMMKHSARFEDGGMLDGLMVDTNVPMQNVGGTTFSTADLTPHMDLTNPAF